MMLKGVAVSVIVGGVVLAGSAALPAHPAGDARRRRCHLAPGQPRHRVAALRAPGSALASFLDRRHGGRGRGRGRDGAIPGARESEPSAGARS